MFFEFLFLTRAQLVELADTLGLEPSAARHGGSTPSLGTISLMISITYKVLRFYGSTHSMVEVYPKSKTFYTFSIRSL